MITVGNAGSGTLTINEGGTVASTLFAAGEEASSVGNVTVAGGTLTNQDVLQLGTRGVGRLDVNGGGQVNTDLILLGEFSGRGEAVVEDNGVLNSSSDLIVGVEGTGRMTVRDEGRVNARIGYVGFGAGSSGSVTVSGSGSQWTGNETLVIGNNGSGVAVVEAGGKTGKRPKHDRIKRLSEWQRVDSWSRLAMDGQRV